jgi:hypothetical protein
MDWTIVVSTAITGAVGVVGVLGGVITSRRSAQLNITAEADRARLNITAEADRARLADKRRIYARALGALDTAMLTDGAARAAEKKHAESVKAGGAAVAVVEDQYRSAAENRAKATEALGSANRAVSELQLIAEWGVDGLTVKLAKDALDSVSDPGVHDGHRKDLLMALRDELGQEARRVYPPK